MNAVMRRAVRRGSAGLGVLALALGAAACGGGDDQEAPTEPEPGVEEPAGEEPAGDEEQDLEPSDGDEGQAEGPADTGASDGGGESDTEGDEQVADGQEVTEEDREEAEARFMEFLDAVAAQDGETACALLLDPETGQTGDQDPECLEGFEEDVAPAIESGALDDLDESMIETEVGEDGTITVLLDGMAFPLSMSRGEDGAWYVTPSTD